MVAKRRGVFTNAAKIPLGAALLLALLPPVLAQDAEEEGPPEKFLRAIRRHDTNTVAQLLAANTNLASVPSFGNRRPLLQAAAEGSIEIVDLLLKAGAAADAEGDTWDTGNHRFTALEIAVWHNHPAIVKRLLETGANPNHLSSTEGSALHMAFAYQREEVAGWLLDHGANPFLLNPFPFNNQKSALELAIVHCNGKLVPRMLRDRAKAEQFLQTNGPAMLAAAACRGQLEAVQALLEAGASAKESANPNRSLLQSVALSAAASSGHPDFSATPWSRILDLLLKHGSDYDVFAATAFGDLEAVRRFSSANKSLAQTTDQFRETPLHWGVKADRLALTDFWLEGGATPGATNLAGQTALHLAAAKGLGTHAQRLLDAKSPTNIRDTNGWTPLDAAMQAKQTATIRLLLEREPASTPSGRGITRRIHEAAKSGNILAMRALLTKENLEARNELGFTPLHVAAQSGQLGAAAFLLDKGADVDARDAEGNTVLHLVLLGQTHWIAGRPSEAWVERKRQEPANEKFWRVFTATNQFHSAKQVAPSVAFFLGCGAEATAKNKAGRTALEITMDEHSMIFDEDRAALLQLFSQSGNGLNKRDANGETALHRAAREIVGDKAEALIAAGADLNATNYHGRTPLHAAAEELGGWGDSQPFNLILNAKPNVNAQDDRGLTPLHVLLLSKSSFHGQATAALLAAGADPNLRDKLGRTPLLAALTAKWPWEGAHEIGQLISAGAKPALADNDGRTALHYLAAMGEQSPMFFVRNASEHFASLDVNATNKVGDTPLHVAVRSGTTDVFDWLRRRGASLDVTNSAGETPHGLIERNRNPFFRFNLRRN